MALAFDPLVQLGDYVESRGCAYVDVGNQDNCAGAAVAGVLEPLVGDHALGIGVVGAVAIEKIGDPAADRTGGDGENDGANHNPATAALDECGETIKHQAAFLVVDLDRFRRAVSRSHQSAMKSLRAMPKRREEEIEPSLPTTFSR